MPFIFVFKSLENEYKMNKAEYKLNKSYEDYDKFFFMFIHALFTIRNANLVQDISSDAQHTIS